MQITWCSGPLHLSKKCLSFGVVREADSVLQCCFEVAGMNPINGSVFQSCFEPANEKANYWIGISVLLNSELVFNHASKRQV